MSRPATVTAERIGVLNVQGQCYEGDQGTETDKVFAEH